MPPAAAASTSPSRSTRVVATWHWVALAVLAVGLALTALIWQLQHGDGQRRAQVEFDAQALEFEHTLSARLRLYRRTLRGARALFAASDDVTHAEWQRYIADQELDDRLPGVQGIGYAVWLPATARPALQARMQARDKRATRRWPATTGPYFSAIEYLSPATDRNLRALGFDMYSERVRREAMARARDSGDAALSGVVRLVQDGAGQVSLPGFLLYVPVYRNGAVHDTEAARRAALQGWVYAALRGSDLVAALLHEQSRAPGFALRIRDLSGAAGAPQAGEDIFRSPAWPQAAQFVASHGFRFSGRRWQIDYASLPAYDAAHGDDGGTLIALIGGVLSVLLALLAGSYARSRQLADLHAQNLREALQKTGEQQRLMIDTVRDYAILQLDADGNVASWNRGAELLKGYRADEILGRHFSQFYPPEDIADGKPEREMAEVRAHGRMEDEGWRVRRDGSRFWGDVVITALYDAAGTIEGYVKVTRDMTQNRQVLHRLQAADRLNTAILDSAAYAIIATDPAGTITVFNRAAERMLGYAAGAMIGKQTPAIVHDASEVAACAAELSQTLQRRIEPGFEVVVARARQNQPDQREWTYIRRDGSRFPVSLAVSALCDADGAIVGFLGIAQDITERRQHEAELAVLFEQSPNATFLIDAQGRVQKLNSQAIALFGYGREELRGQPVEILLPDNLRADHVAHRSHYARAPRTRAMGADMALSARRRNGEVFPVEVMLAPIEIGGETHTLAIARDVTERKQQEAAQQKSLREKEVLLQEIHHRVKNNLQVIYSLLDLQADTVDDAATLTLLRDAQARVHAMALIHQTLYQSNNFAAVDLGAYLSTLLNDFAATHSRPEIRLDTQLDTVYLDVQNAVPCGLLINELLTNAYKHAFPDRRSGTLSVSLCQHENRVHLIVADDGVGMTPDARTRGTLGIKLVYVLAEQLHAQLEYSGDPGTRVTLAFSTEAVLHPPAADKEQ